MEFKKPIFDYLLVKLAASCNLDCGYCYWFRDLSVFKQPTVMPVEIEKLFLGRLEEHIAQHKLLEMSILFHGGEPMLMGKRRFLLLCDSLAKLAERSGAHLSLAMTTNGTLIDPEWVAIIKHYMVHPTLSFDGRADVHNAARRHRNGKGSFEKTKEGFDLLVSSGITPGILSVCNPGGDPVSLYEFISKDLGVKHFDVLFPDHTHEDELCDGAVSQYYIKLFDCWFDNYAQDRVELRIFSAMIAGLFGRRSSIESIGFGPIQTCTIMPDGSLEALDVLRIRGDGSNRSSVHLSRNTFQDVQLDPTWVEAFVASTKLADVCEECNLRNACGGGHLAHRWSRARRYDNPSIFCNDIKSIFSHIVQRVSPHIKISGRAYPAGISLAELL